MDIFANCLSFIAIVEDGKLLGFNVAVGGGMGSTHNNEKTYPRLADVIGFCTVDQVVDVAEKVVLVQRDFGDRTDRKHSRFKYTVDDHGAEWILAKLNEYLGYELGPVRPFRFDDNGDRFSPACVRSPGSMTATSASPPTKTSSSPTSRPPSARRSKSCWNNTASRTAT